MTFSRDAGDMEEVRFEGWREAIICSKYSIIFNAHFR